MKTDDSAHGTPTGRAVAAEALARQLDIGEALAAAGTAAWRWRRDDPAIEWTPGAADTLGIPDIILRSPELLLQGLQPGDLELISHAVEHATPAGVRIAVRLPVRLGPHVRWYDVAGTGLADETGILLEATGTVTEVTDRHQGAEAVVAALEEAESSLDQLLALAWTWDPNSGLLNVTRQPQGITLAPEVPDEVTVAAMVARMGETHGSRFRDALAMCWLDGRPVTLESCIRDDDHRDRRMLLRARPAATGDHFEVVGVLLD